MSELPQLRAGLALPNLNNCMRQLAGLLIRKYEHHDHKRHDDGDAETQQDRTGTGLHFTSHRHLSSLPTLFAYRMATVLPNGSLSLFLSLSLSPLLFSRAQQRQQPLLQTADTRPGVHLRRACSLILPYEKLRAPEITLCTMLYMYKLPAKQHTFLPAAHSAIYVSATQQNGTFKNKTTV
ncbi:hypothetical protein GQ43DRAFT_489375 [Delitschia confertaspora ATCC 74209]|uniref:Uncharacterized protein n=1 Tax=Delitschia confertaspora ATCC 74209 TaxID=1513339 RepID=A0A9P4MRI2_9PLEO|nr:hypothetical protein GQ43DRAFT_489375 [Delitschia confertaspora ATCC 74209]